MDRELQVTESATEQPSRRHDRELHDLALSCFRCCDKILATSNWAKGSFWHRTCYSISRIVVTRTDSGHDQFNFSERS
jgi:hypothetical protein